MSDTRLRDADVIVIGGGIIGCASAAMIATRGARVVLVEATAIGAGASGRNLGAIQHPFDAVLAPLYEESILRYRALAGLDGERFAIGGEPAGLLLLHPTREAAVAQAFRLNREQPDLGPRLIESDELSHLEPSLAPGPTAVRLATGFPIPPASATEAWAAFAAARGASLLVGRRARPLVDGDRARGVTLEDGTTIRSDRVLVAAGPWTPALVDADGAWRPILPTYGVTLQLRLGRATPRHIIEEDAADDTSRMAPPAEGGGAAELAEPPSLFSIASAAGLSTLGSTFLARKPDPAVVEPILLRRAAAFLPAVAEAEVVERRMCARPQSVDGRPLIGAVPGVDGLFVCAGHGPWGISTGPATAAIAARAVLDGTSPPAELAADRAV